MLHATSYGPDWPFTPTRREKKLTASAVREVTTHYLDLVQAGRIDLRPMLTHTFPLERWRDAFLAIANQGESGAVKVAIDQR